MLSPILPAFPTKGHHHASSSTALSPLRQSRPGWAPCHGRASPKYARSCRGMRSATPLPGGKALKQSGNYPLPTPEKDQDEALGMTTVIVWSPQTIYLLEFPGQMRGTSTSIIQQMSLGPKARAFTFRSWPVNFRITCHQGKHWKHSQVAPSRFWMQLRANTKSFAARSTTEVPSVSWYLKRHELHLPRSDVPLEDQFVRTTGDKLAVVLGNPQRGVALLWMGIQSFGTASRNLTSQS